MRKLLLAALALLGLTTGAHAGIMNGMQIVNGVSSTQGTDAGALSLDGVVLPAATGRAAPAAAPQAELSDGQMDKVKAGWTFNPLCCGTGGNLGGPRSSR